MRMRPQSCRASESSGDDRRAHAIVPGGAARHDGGPDCLVGAAPALAQMPDLRTISGKPLPVNDLPPGTVVVRVVRQSLANAAVGVEVSATTRAPSGDARTGVMKTGADGRASSRTCPAAAEFQATVTVDGESLQTEALPGARSRAACG